MSEEIPKYYEKLKVIWLKKRQRTLELLASGMPRKDVAKKMGITRQRLSQIENAKVSGR